MYIEATVSSSLVFARRFISPCEEGGISQNRYKAVCRDEVQHLFGRNTAQGLLRRYQRISNTRAVGRKANERQL